jgi:hypothetical protein
VWANVAPKTALAPPSPEAKRQLACKSIDLETGEMQSSGGGKAITECLRVDAKGKVLDTQFQLVSRESAPTRPDTPSRASLGRANQLGDSARNYGWSSWQGGGQSNWQGGGQSNSQGAAQPNWQREYRLHHPD